MRAIVRGRPRGNRPAHQRPGIGRQDRSGVPLKRSVILRSGLCLHLGDMLEREDMVGRSIDHDQLRIVLLLEGSLDMTYAGQSLQLNASRGGAGAASQVDAAMVSMAVPTEVQRRARRGDYAKRISIGAGGDWIEQSLQAGGATGLSPGQFLERTLAARCWRASVHTRVLAEQILNPPPLPENLVGLYLESRVISLVVEALAGETTRAWPERALKPAVHRRMCEVREYLEVKAGGELNMEQIARHAGTSVATLQRNFRQAHGLTVSAYVLQVRLSRARHALEYEGASVARAALLAGYANPANFATAFRRQYGLSPRQVRPGL